MASSAPTLQDKPRVLKQYRRVDIAKILIYVVLIIGAIISLIPFLYTVSTSLMNLTEATGRTLVPRVPQWSNYLEAWDDANFSRYLWNSVRLAALTLAGQLVFCTLAGYAFARMRFPGKEFIYTLVLATLMLPEAVTWVPNFITITWLSRISPIPWYDNWPALTVPFMASAFGIMILRQFFQQIPEELWDAARIDGAGHGRYLRQIVLPLSQAPMMTIIIFGFNGAWNALAWPILVTNNPDWRPISFGLLAFLDEAGTQFHLQMAGSVITLLPILILYFLVQKQFIEGVAHTGLKG